MKRLFTIIFGFISISLPGVTSAQGLVTCDGNSFAGIPCDFCQFIAMVEGVGEFIVGILILISVIMLAVTGVQLAYFAAGGSDAREILKERLINIVIGFFLIIASWTLVDTMLKALVIDDSVTNIRDNWRTPAAQLCGSQLPPSEEDLQVVVSEETERCEYDSATGGYTNCDTLEESCEDEGGEVVVDQTDPSERTVTCKIENGVEVAVGGACDRSTMETINFLGKSVTIHKDAVAAARRVDKRWRDLGGNSYYRVNQIGSYSCRKIAGSGRYSYHAYGLAIDINWGGGASDPNSPNPHCPSWRACGGRNVVITDMNKVSPSLYSIFQSEGWGWGGNWSSSKDTMHFSAASSEGGFINIRR